MSKFEVKEVLSLTDGSTVDLRPQWNVDGRSIVFERKTATGAMLCLKRGSAAIPHPVDWLSIYPD